MNNILIKSQDGKFTGFCKYIGIGARQPKLVIGDELKTLLEDKKMSSEELVEKIGNSYRNNIERILKNEEQPNGKHIQIITNALNVDKDYFTDKEIENVIVTDNNIVVGRYSTNARAIEVKNELDKSILENFAKGTYIILIMPEK